MTKRDSVGGIAYTAPGRLRCPGSIRCPPSLPALPPSPQHTPPFEFIIWDPTRLCDLCFPLLRESYRWLPAERGLGPQHGDLRHHQRDGGRVSRGTGDSQLQSASTLPHPASGQRAPTPSHHLCAQRQTPVCPSGPGGVQRPSEPHPRQEHAFWSHGPVTPPDRWVRGLETPGVRLARGPRRSRPFSLPAAPQPGRSSQARASWQLRLGGAHVPLCILWAGVFGTLASSASKNRLSFP